jgi:hypothetical protein
MKRAGTRGSNVEPEPQAANRALALKVKTAAKRRL